MTFEYTVTAEEQKVMDSAQTWGLICTAIAILRIAYVLYTGTLSPVEAVAWSYLCLRYRTAYQMTCCNINNNARFRCLKELLENH